MSSSTMIHGATMRRPKPQRTIADATTSDASHAQAGRERTMALDSSRTFARDALAAKPDLVEQAHDLRRLLALGRDPHVRGGLGHLADDRVPSGLAARGLLQRGRVRVGHAVEVVLTSHVLAR